MTADHVSTKELQVSARMKPLSKEVKLRNWKMSGEEARPKQQMLQLETLSTMDTAISTLLMHLEAFSVKLCSVHLDIFRSVPSEMLTCSFGEHIICQPR